jgi:2-polyprenyl-6-methoxyphenol hydroxylase-like FAD-dependent oxidoreductase
MRSDIKVRAKSRHSTPSYFSTRSSSPISIAAMAQKPILIAGAGLASLLLGQVLRRASIPFLIYERDASISFRGQGYRLRLSSQGLDAIESALGPEMFATFWDKCGKTRASATGGIDTINVTEKTAEQLDAVYAKNADVAKQDSASQSGPVENLGSRDGKIVGVSRGDMRQTFLSGCEAFIRWSHKVTGYESTSTGVRLIFDDGSKSDEGQMLIGGEGIYSYVAKQLSQGKIKNFDSGARGIHGQAPTIAFKGLGEGVWMLEDYSNPKGKVFTITNVRPGDMDDPSIDFGWTLGAQPGVFEGSDEKAYSVYGSGAADIAKELTKNWHPRVRPLFEQMNEKEAAFWKITCSSPSGVAVWQNDPRVTVIGDAVSAL